MNAVCLDGSGNVHKILVDHWHNCCSVFCSEVREDLVELVNVVWAIVGWEGDASDQYFDLCILKSREDGVEIGTRLVEGKATEAIISTELNNDDCRMQGNNRMKANNRVFAGCATGSFVRNFVVVAKFVEVALKGVWIGLARHEPVTGSYAIAIADKQRAMGSQKRPAKKQ
jgi:hypothetical protein